MSELSFQCNFRSWELRALALPVEVRKPNLALVARTLSNQTVQVQPGTYYVTVKLPAGQEMLSRVIVGEHRETVAILEPQPEDASPNESLELQTYIIGHQAIPLPDEVEGEESGSTDLDAKLRIFGGNLLDGSYLEKAARNWLEPLQAPLPHVANFEVCASGTQFVQLLQPQVPPINVALPVSQEQSCQLILTRLRNGMFSIDASLESIEANTLLQYLHRGFLTEATTIITSDILVNNPLFSNGAVDPISAAVGAYALLRLGDLDRLHSEMKNLRDWFAFLPDGIACVAELLARRGEHERALAVLLDLSTHGLPIFSDGLSYAINRLSLYITANRSAVTPQLIEQTQIRRAQTLLKQLQQFAEYVDFRQPFLTFTGIDPGKPDAEPLNRDIASFEGVDVNSSFLLRLTAKEEREDMSDKAVLASDISSIAQPTEIMRSESMVERPRSWWQKVRQQLNSVTPYLLILPSILFVLIIAIYPMIDSLLLSFLNDPLGPSHTFVGLDNYFYVLTDRLFQFATATTFSFDLTSVALEITLGLGVAILINKTIRIRSLAFVLILMPWAVPTVLSAQMWSLMYNGQTGIITYLLQSSNLLAPGNTLTSSPGGVVIAALIADAWKMMPLMTFLFLTGLRAIPKEVYESATIDGASRWRQLWFITMPMLRNQFLIALLFRSLDAIRVFDLFYVFGQRLVPSMASYAFFHMFGGTTKDFAAGIASSVVIVLFGILICFSILICFNYLPRMRDMLQFSWETSIQWIGSLIC